MSINYPPNGLYISGNKVPGHNVLVDKKEGELDVRMSFFIKRACIFTKKTLKKENTYIRIG
jgi:hypothetical protein